MFTTILTWAGALLGITVLVAMAFGSVAMDFDTARFKGWHRRSRREKHARQS